MNQQIVCFPAIHSVQNACQFLATIIPKVAFDVDGSKNTLRCALYLPKIGKSGFIGSLLVHTQVTHGTHKHTDGHRHTHIHTDVNVLVQKPAHMIFNGNLHFGRRTEWKQVAKWREQEKLHHYTIRKTFIFHDTSAEIYLQRMSL